MFSFLKKMIALANGIQRIQQAQRAKVDPFDEAFDAIISTTLLDTDLWPVAKASIQETINKGSRESAKDLYENIGGAWEWPWLEEWMAVFKKTGKWPYLYREVQEILEAERPTDVKTALKYFTVAELKNWLKIHEIKHDCKTREQLESFFLESVPWYQLDEDAGREFDSYIEKNKKRLEVFKCMLLAHSVCTRFHATNHTINGAPSPSIRKTKLCLELDDCPHAKKASKEYQRTGALPPYYPGDRSGLRRKLVK